MRVSAVAHGVMEMFKNISRIVKLYLSLKPYDRVKAGCYVALPGAVFVFIYIFSQLQIYGVRIPDVLDSSDVMYCDVKVAGGEYLESRSGGRVSIVDFVDRQGDGGCLLVARGVKKTSVSYLNSGSNNRRLFYEDSDVRLYFAKSEEGWRAFSISTIDNEVIVGREKIDGYYELRSVQNFRGMFVSSLALLFGLGMAFVSWFNYLRGISFRDWGSVVVDHDSCR